MSQGISGKYAIVGIGETAVGKLHGRSTMSLHLEAVSKALDDAGLQAQDVDGLLTNQPMHDPMRSYALAVANAAGIKRNFLTDLALGGATPVAMAQHAAMAIEVGLCDTVVCVHARNQATSRELPKRAQIRDGYEDFDEPYGFLGAVANHAFIASRHMHNYGDYLRTAGSRGGIDSRSCRFESHRHHAETDDHRRPSGLSMDCRTPSVV